MNALEKRDYQSLIHSARIVVRETGAAAQDAEHMPQLDGRMRRLITTAYDMACAHLTQLDPAGAAEFIRSTYGPSFRHTEPPRETAADYEAGISPETQKNLRILGANEKRKTK